MADLNPKWIIGKRVARVDLNQFKDERGQLCHKPRIWFEDGSHIAFTTEEVEGGADYGTHISYWKPAKKERA
jgi:hypothetical protein